MWPLAEHPDNRQFNQWTQSGLGSPFFTLREYIFASGQGSDLRIGIPHLVKSAL
jgi:hypothetical protein